jgi:small subunit ribosomal protein S6
MEAAYNPDPFLWVLMAKGRKIALNEYETIFIIRPDVETEDVDRITQQVQDLISDNGGVVTRVNNWGKKRLAYEVAGNRDGIYVIINLEAEPQIVPALGRYYGLDEQIIKHMTIKAENLLESRTETSTDEESEVDEDDEDDEDEDEEE